MSHWTTRYIGLPYHNKERLDCWQLLRLVYNNELGIHLPELPGVEDARFFSRWAELEWPVEFCAVGMTRKETIHHVGVWTMADGGRIVHCWDGMPVVADTRKTLKLRGLRVVQFYGLHHRDTESVPATLRA